MNAQDNKKRKQGGSLYVWGSSSCGQLGLGNNEDQLVAPQLVQLSNVCSISFGVAHSVAITGLPHQLHISQISENGQLYTWGGNEHGQLGLGDCRSRNTPQLVSHFKDQTVVVAKCGGMHTVAQLGTTTYEFLKRYSTRYRQILYLGTK